MNKQTYMIAADIQVNKTIMRGYYTVTDNWVFEESYPEIEFFLSVKAAQDRLAPILNLINEGFRYNKITKIYILNNKGFIVRQYNL
jgi:hypothetical protein